MNKSRKKSCTSFRMFSTSFTGIYRELLICFAGSLAYLLGQVSRTFRESWTSLKGSLADKSCTVSENLTQISQEVLHKFNEKLNVGSRRNLAYFTESLAIYESRTLN